MAEKTNVMRTLDKMKLKYQSYCYVDSDAVNGVEVVAVLNLNPDRVFKTLVTVGKSNKYYVFMIPVAQELDLKKAADAVGDKAIEMVKAKDLLAITGYVHGGCSPINMKKSFPTIIHESADSFETIVFSAGKIGYQVEIGLEDLIKVIEFNLANVVNLK